MPHNKEIEEIIKEFENMGHSHLYPEGVINGSCFYCRHCKSNDFICKDCVRNFLRNTLTSYGKSQYDKGVEEGLSMMSKFLVASIDKYNK